MVNPPNLSYVARLHNISFWAVTTKFFSPL
jgi:hypothetical protein